VRLPEPAAALATRHEQRYRNDGYDCAHVQATLSAEGALTLDVSEGRIDEVRLEGAGAEASRRIRAELGIHTGDVFNRSRLDRAFERVQRATEGAFRPRVSDGFDRACPLVERDGRHVLGVDLRPRDARFTMFAGTDDREDWFSPVDGLVPALGFRLRLFDHRRFNPTFLTGYASYRFGRERAGYSLAVEQPLVQVPRLTIGAEVHDLTASDDFWRLSVLEQTLVAVTFKDTFRDYYGRKGYQLHAAVTVAGSHEVVVAWRNDRESSLANSTDFSIFKGGEAFRENEMAAAGRLHAVVLRYAFDSRAGFEQGPEGAYRRHRVDSFFGTASGDRPGVRLTWTSEWAGAFGGDFSFGRHVFDARATLQPSPRQEVGGRVIAGLGVGDLPPQRTFALGGIGSVHGYDFKAAAGGRMVLVNAEYEASTSSRWNRRGSGLRGIVFLDAGRIGRPAGDGINGWLVGAGVGAAVGAIRVDFGWPLKGPSHPLQVLVRIGRTF